MTPRARLNAEAAADLGAFHVDARAAWRFAPEAPGAEDLRLRTRLDVSLGGGWTLTPALRGEFAGLAGGPAGEDWVEGELAAHHGDDTRIALRAREGLAPPTLRNVVIAAETPIELTRSLTVVPHLAVDVAPWLAGGLPGLHGHGLKLYVEDCCGTFVVGYRATAGAWSVELDVRLPPLDLGESPLPESLLQDVPLLLGPAPGSGPGPAAPGGPGPGGPVPLPAPPGGGPEPLPSSPEGDAGADAATFAGYGGPP